MEHLPRWPEKWKEGNREEIIRIRWPFIPVVRTGEAIHRIELFTDTHNKPKTIWTIFITGPIVGSWGFYCPWGLRDHNEFLQQTGENVSITGKGCD